MPDAHLEDPEDAPSLDDPAYQQGVFKDAYEQTCLQLSGKGTGADMATLRRINIARNQAIDALAEGFAEDANADCRAGCSFCCHQMVVCTPVEIFDMARHILDEKSLVDMAAIKDRLTQRASLPLDVPSRRGIDKPCALLDDNRCAIYAQRPANCRTMLSTSRTACETSLITQEQIVPFIPEPGVIAFLMQLGIDYALIKQSQLSTEKVELSRALLIALEGFETAFKTWSDGEDAFPGCHIETGRGPSNQELAQRAAVQSGLL